MSGSPSKSVVVGYGNSDKKSKGWCVETASFHDVADVDSQWGTVELTVNGKAVAQYTCTAPNPCGDDTKQIDPIKLAKPGAVISWRVTNCTDATGNPCTGDQQFKVTITVGYEPALTV